MIVVPSSTAEVIKDAIRTIYGVDVSSVYASKVQLSSDVVVIICPFDLSMMFRDVVEEHSARVALSVLLRLPIRNIEVGEHRVRLVDFQLKGPSYWVEG